MTAREIVTLMEIERLALALQVELQGAYDDHAEELTTIQTMARGLWDDRR